MSGRPIKLTVEYFAHYIGGGKKMHYIENKYGNDGYSTWYKMLEQLAQTENHYIDLSDDVQTMYLASFCRVSEAVLIDIIEDIVKLKEFDAELWSIKIIWCQKFIDSIQTAYLKRSNNCITRELLIDMLVANGKMTATKKESKKVAKIETVSFNFKKELIEYGADPDLVSDWLLVRGKRKAANTKTALKIFISEVEKSKLNVNDVLKECASRSWISFKHTWSLNNGNQQAKPTHVNSGDNVDWENVSKNG